MLWLLGAIYSYLIIRPREFILSLTIEIYYSFVNGARCNKLPRFMADVRFCPEGVDYRIGVDG
jgi:hypothetical protein